MKCTIKIPKTNTVGKNRINIYFLSETIHSLRRKEQEN
jgi:hypothetical protein